MAEPNGGRLLPGRQSAAKRRPAPCWPKRASNALLLALLAVGGGIHEAQGADNSNDTGTRSNAATTDHTGAKPRTFYVEEIKAATEAHIAQRLNAEGTFRIHDPVTDKTLSLRFVKVHDPVRRIDGDTYFACTDFEVVGQSGQLFDLDFWLKPNGEQLEVIDEKIHKEPRHALLYGWYKHPRYTFVDDQIVPLYED